MFAQKLLKDSYLKNKPPDCILYSEDGVEFKSHKKLFCQTKFMRELLKCGNCCGTIDIIFPCSKEELAKLIDFVVHGKIQCEDEIVSSKVFENLSKILGFPTDLDHSGKFTFDDRNDTTVNDDSFATNTINENERRANHNTNEHTTHRNRESNHHNKTSTSNND